MPGEDNIPRNGTDAGASLEGAVTRWNARANAAYLDISDLIGAVQEDFEGLSSLIARRQELVPLLALDQTKAVPLEDLSATTLTGLNTMEESIANFHIELQTLHAQIRRAVGAGESLAGEMKHVVEGASVVPVGPNPNLGGAVHTVPIKTAREAQLASQVDTLRAELLRVKDEVSDLRAKAAQRTMGVPAEAQNEIARLRARVLELMVIQSQTQPKGKQQVDLSVQYERIMHQAQDEYGRRRRMGDILILAGVLADEQLETALREQQTSWNRHLGAVLVDLGYVSEDTIAQTLAAQVRVPYVRLIHEKPSPEALSLLSKALAHHHSCVPLRFERETLVVAMANPLDLVAIDDIELATRRSIKPVVASASEIKATLKECYR